MQNSFFAANYERVARIVTALKPGDSRSTISQQVDDFALTLVTPLGADDDNTLTHRSLPYYVEHDDPGRRDREPGQPQAHIIHLRDAGNGLPKQVRSCERDHALDNKVDRKAG